MLNVREMAADLKPNLKISKRKNKKTTSKNRPKQRRQKMDHEPEPIDVQLEKVNYTKIAGNILHSRALALLKKEPLDKHFKRPEQTSITWQLGSIFDLEPCSPHEAFKQLSNFFFAQAFTQTAILRSDPQLTKHQRALLILSEGKSTRQIILRYDSLRLGRMVRDANKVTLTNRELVLLPSAMYHSLANLKDAINQLLLNRFEVTIFTNGSKWSFGHEDNCLKMVAEKSAGDVYDERTTIVVEATSRCHELYGDEDYLCLNEWYIKGKASDTVDAPIDHQVSTLLSAGTSLKLEILHRPESRGLVYLNGLLLNRYPTNVVGDYGYNLRCPTMVPSEDGKPSVSLTKLASMMNAILEKACSKLTGPSLALIWDLLSKGTLAKQVIHVALKQGSTWPNKFAEQWRQRDQFPCENAEEMAAFTQWFPKQKLEIVGENYLSLLRGSGFLPPFQELIRQLEQSAPEVNSLRSYVEASAAMVIGVQRSIVFVKFVRQPSLQFAIIKNHAFGTETCRVYVNLPVFEETCRTSGNSLAKEIIGHMAHYLIERTVFPVAVRVIVQKLKEITRQAEAAETAAEEPILQLNVQKPLSFASHLDKAAVAQTWNSLEKRSVEETNENCSSLQQSAKRQRIRNPENRELSIAN